MKYVMKCASSLLKSMQAAQEKRVAYWQLQNLTDDDLNDIGVSRGEIWHKIYGK